MVEQAQSPQHASERAGIALLLLNDRAVLRSV